MKILPEPITFEWDEGNKDKNFRKHNVANKEIEQSFANDNKFFFSDTKHSVEEERQLMWGVTDRGRKLSIIFTLRKDSIRVISARDMNKKERGSYEEKIKSNTNI